MKSKAQKNIDFLEKLTKLNLPKELDPIHKERFAEYCFKIINSVGYSKIKFETHIRNKITKKIGKMHSKANQLTKEEIFINLQEKLDKISKKKVLKKKNEILHLLFKISEEVEKDKIQNSILSKKSQINQIIQNAEIQYKMQKEKSQRCKKVDEIIEKQKGYEIESQDLVVLDFLRFLKDESTSLIKITENAEYQFKSEIKLSIQKKKIILDLCQIHKMSQSLKNYVTKMQKKILCQTKSLFIKYIKLQIQKFTQMINSLIETYQEDYKVFEEEYTKDQMQTKRKFFSIMELVVIFEEPKYKLKNLLLFSESCYAMNDCMIISSIYSYFKFGNERMKTLGKEILNYIISPFEKFCLNWMNQGTANDSMQEFFIKIIPKINNISDEDCWVEKNQVPIIIDKEMKDLIFLIGRETRIRDKLGLSYVKKKNILRFDFIETNLEVNKGVLLNFSNNFRKKLVNEYIKKFRFKELVDFIKKTYMMQMGDFIDELIHKMDPILSQEASEVNFHEIMPLFRSVTEISSLKLIESPFLNLFGVKLLDKLDGDLGWNIFTFELRVR